MGLLEKIAAQLKQPDESILGKFVVGAMMCATTVANDWTVALMDIQPTDHVLEIGFGPGLTIKNVAKIVSEGFVAGIDCSEAMVRQARKRNAAAIQDGRVDLQYGDISASLPYEEHTFEKVFSTHCIYFWPQPLESVQELRRVLKPGGMIATTVWTEDEFSMKHLAQTGLYAVYTAEELIRILEEAGFSNIRFDTTSSIHASAICAVGVK